MELVSLNYLCSLLEKTEENRKARNQIVHSMQRVTDHITHLQIYNFEKDGIKALRMFLIRVGEKMHFTSPNFTRHYYDDMCYLQTYWDNHAALMRLPKLRPSADRIKKTILLYGFPLSKPREIERLTGTLIAHYCKKRDSKDNPDTRVRELFKVCPELRDPNIYGVSYEKLYAAIPIILELFFEN